MKEAFIKLHLSVLLAGGTGVFGKLITLNEFMLVWYRLLLAAILFYFVLKISGSLKEVSRKDILKIGLVGTLLALHWVFFYASIKFSNVSIGVVCLSLMSFFYCDFRTFHKQETYLCKGDSFQPDCCGGNSSDIPLRYQI